MNNGFCSLYDVGFTLIKIEMKFRPQLERGWPFNSKNGPTFFLQVGHSPQSFLHLPRPLRVEIISHEHKLQENICFSLCLKIHVPISAYQNSTLNPNWDSNPDLFCFQNCSTIELFGCFVCLIAKIDKTF